MKIALIAHDEKKNEMVNFTIAYEHIFSKYTYLLPEQRKKNHGRNKFIRNRLNVRTFRRRSANWCDGCDWRFGLNPFFP